MSKWIEYFKVETEEYCVWRSRVVEVYVGVEAEKVESRVLGGGLSVYMLARRLGERVVDLSASEGH
jgi:hypothetical protein